MGKTNAQAKEIYLKRKKQNSQYQVGDIQKDVLNLEQNFCNLGIKYKLTTNKEEAMLVLMDNNVGVGVMAGAVVEIGENT